jgi:hypothetical protein
MDQGDNLGGRENQQRKRKVGSLTRFRLDRVETNSIYTLRALSLVTLIVKTVLTVVVSFCRYND